jgi:hypothetical protein
MLLRTPSRTSKTYIANTTSTLMANNWLTLHFTYSQKGVLLLLPIYFFYAGGRPLYVCSTIVKFFRSTILSSAAISNSGVAHLPHPVSKISSTAERLGLITLPLRQANLSGIGYISTISRLTAKRMRYYYKLPSLSKQLLLRTIFTHSSVVARQQLLKTQTGVLKRGTLNNVRTQTQSYYNDAAISVLLIRFLEFLVQTRVSLLIARSPYTAMSANEVASISLFRGRLTA